MIQKSLTEKQLEIVEQLRLILQMARENNITLLCDSYDDSLTAVNNDGVECFSFADNCSDSAEPIDWGKCEIVSTDGIFTFHCEYDKVVVEPEK